MKKIKIVLSGSGTRYPVHLGGLLRLAEEDIEISEICGTSGGAIIAAAIASGYPVHSDSVALLKELLPAKNGLIDYSLWSFIFQWGLIKGDKLEKVFDQYFAKTMGEVVIPLSIITTNIERKTIRVFSSATDPKMSLSKVVRASMSIPGVFTPVVIEDEMYVDGGLTGNYMLDVYGAGEDVIGFRFGQVNRSRNFSDKPKIKIKNAKDYISANIEAMLDATTSEHIEDAMLARTISLKTNHSGLNFKMTDKDVDEMIQDGYNCVDRWLKSYSI